MLLCEIRRYPTPDWFQEPICTEVEYEEQTGTGTERGREEGKGHNYKDPRHIERTRDTYTRRGIVSTKNIRTFRTSLQKIEDVAETWATETFDHRGRIITAEDVDAFGGCR